MKHDSCNLEGYERLCVAVVEQAVKDYRRALRRLYNHPDDRAALKGKRNVNGFSVGI